MPIHFVALAYSLIHEDGGGDTDIERVEAAEHRDTDMHVGSLAPDGGETRRLRTHHDGGGPAHVVVVILIRVLQLRRKDTYLIGF